MQVLKEYSFLLTKIKAYFFIDTLFLHTHSKKFFIYNILTRGVNISLCVNYKVFVFHISIFTEKLPLKTDTAAYLVDFAWAPSTRSSKSSLFRFANLVSSVFCHFGFKYSSREIFVYFLISD